MKIFSVVLPPFSTDGAEGVDTVHDRLRKSRMIRVVTASSVVRMKRERDRDRRRDQRRREKGGISGHEVGWARSWAVFAWVVIVTYL